MNLFKISQLVGTGILLSQISTVNALDMNSIFDSGKASAVEASNNTKSAAKGLSGNVDFGLVITTGNSETTTTTGKFAMVDDREKWRHQFKFEAIQAESDGEDTVERYLTNIQIDRKLEKGKYLFGAIIHDVDKFSGFDYQSTMVVGYGKIFYDNKKFKLSADIGPGYRYSQFDAGGNEQEAIIHVGAKSEYNFTESTKLAGNVSVDNGSEQTITFLDIGFVSKVTDDISIKLNYNVKNTSNAPVGSSSTDTVTSINIVYGF